MNMIFDGSFWETVTRMTLLQSLRHVWRDAVVRSLVSISTTTIRFVNWNATRMMKLPLIIGNGMASVFCVVLVVQNLMAQKMEPVFASDVTPEAVSVFFREFGLPTGFAIIFGMACVFGAVRWYRDLMGQIERKNKIIEIKDQTIAELKDEVKKLTWENAFYQGKQERNDVSGMGRNDARGEEREANEAG